jgi:hypothetical protein
MFNPALVNLVARNIDAARSARQRRYDGFGEPRDVSLIPLNYFCVASIDSFVGLESAGYSPRAIGSLRRSG